MFGLPTNRINADQCIKCGSTMEFLNNVRYCQSCKECPIIIEEELKIVPKNYRPFDLGGKFASFLRIEQFVRDFLIRLNLPQNQSKINQLIQTVSALHLSRGTRCKGYRQESAAVIYCVYENEHKLSIRRFCQKNNVEVKKFHKMYLLYKHFLKQRKTRQEDQIFEEVDLKQQESSQNNIKLQQEEQVKQQVELQQQNLPIVSTQQKQRQNLIQITISKIYDKIFERPYFQTIKKQFKKRLTAKITKVDGQLHSQEVFLTVKEYYQIPYTIFGVIKGNGYNISMRRYIEIVQNILKVQLKQKLLSRYHKQIKNIITKWQSHQETISQSNPTRSMN